MAPVGTQLRTAVRTAFILLVLITGSLFCYAMLPGCTATQVAKTAQVASVVIKAIMDILPLLAQQDPAGTDRVLAACQAGDEKLAAKLAARIIVDMKANPAHDPRQLPERLASGHEARAVALIMAAAEVD